MSENEKDNKNFEFIKEQVLVKKRKKAKKILLTLITTVFMAIMFGLIAAVTFVIAEPKFYKHFHKEEDTRTPVDFPTEKIDNPIISSTPVSQDSDTTEVNKSDPVTEPDIEPVTEPNEEPDTVYVKELIEADLKDFLNINGEIRKLSYELNKSVVDITSTFAVKDWLGETVEKRVSTTGVVIYNNNQELLILASLDRVKDAKSLKIDITKTISVDAVLHDYESELNLAIIAVTIEDIPENYLNSVQVATLGESSSLTVGNPIMALGNPDGNPRSLEIGYVTSRSGWANITDNRLDLFNVDVHCNSNSDGIIVNFEGEIVGIITRTLKDNVNSNLCTAIGISKALPIIKNMGNKKPRIYFGIMADDMTELTKKEYDISNGIYVNEVLANSPAFKAELQNGDIILEVNEHSILNTNDFYNTISEYKAGDTIRVKIKRTSGTTAGEMNLEVVLGEKNK